MLRQQERGNNDPSLNNPDGEELEEWYHWTIKDIGIGAYLPERELENNINISSGTRYDDMLVAPSDEDLRIMWIIYSTLLFIFAIFMSIVFLAIVTNKKLRRNTFNLYLIFLMVPDLIFTALCGINCAWLAINGGYRFPGMCAFQSFYLIFGIGANAWLNGIIAYEVHKMLKLSNAGQRYNLPQRWIVIRNSLLAYTWTAFVALWGVLPFPWLPHKTNVQNGLFCVPLEFSKVSTIFFWAIYMPLLLLLPLIYCVCVTVHVVRRKLLPQRGQRRGLAIYFFRIVTVFIVMWGPLLIVLWAVGGGGGKPWVVWATGLWGHLQGPVSAGVSCFKLDIRKAVIKLVCSFGELRQEEGRVDTTNCGRNASHTITAVSSHGRRVRSSLSSGHDQDDISCDSVMITGVSCITSQLIFPFRRRPSSPMDFIQEQSPEKMVEKKVECNDAVISTTEQCDRQESLLVASCDIEDAVLGKSSLSQDEGARRSEEQYQP